MSCFWAPCGGLEKESFGERVDFAFLDGILVWDDFWFLDEFFVLGDFVDFGGFVLFGGLRCFKVWECVFCR